MMVIAMAMLPTVQLSAYDFKEGSLAFTIIGDGTEVEVAQKSTGEGTVVIPATVVHDGVTYTVTAIGNGAFSLIYDVTGIQLPETITRIGSYAFYRTQLSSINLPESITEIQSHAFRETHLSAVTLPSHVTAIAEGLYFNCPMLNEVIIPDHITSIKANAFGECVNLTKVVMKERLTEIGDLAFMGCTSLTDITLPGSLASIGFNAFENTGFLSSQSGAGMVYIGNVAYKYVGSISSSKPIEIREGTLGIAGGAFYDKPSLTSILLPESLITIGTNAFYNCGLTSIDIPQSVTSIGGGAFYGCTKLSSVEIPDGVKAIYGQLFYGCKSLTTVKFPGAYTELGANIFYGTNVSHVTLPTTLRKMHSDAFYGANITSLTLNGEGAFEDIELTPDERGKVTWRVQRVQSLVVEPGVTRLPDFKELNPSEIYCFGVTPPAFDNAFAGYGATLHVPQKALAAYYADEKWSQFANLHNDIAPMESLTLNTESLTLEKGETVTLEVNIEPQALYESMVRFTSSNSRVAKVSSGGEVIAVGYGECDITAHCLDMVAVCHVEVPYPDFRLTLSESEAVLHEGQKELLLTADVDNADMASKVWAASSDDNVATVTKCIHSSSEPTKVNVIAVGFGKCDIVVKCADHQASCHIIVSDQIAVDRQHVAVSVGKMVTITPTVVPLGAVLSAASDNGEVAVARVSGGSIQALGLKPGFATVTVSDAQGDAQPVECHVMVVDDMNGDGVVDVGEVNQVLDAILNSNYNSGMDANGDHAVDVGDVNAILKAILESEDIH